MAVAAHNVVEGLNLGPSPHKRRDIHAVKTLIVETADTVDAGDTVPLTLADYNISKVLAVLGFKHTTNNSVVVTENPTTAVSSGILTITVPAGTDNDKRIYEIHYV